MAEYVSTFQLGSSTVVTLPKKLGIKPGTKLEYKKNKNGLSLKLDKKKSFLELLEKTRGMWADDATFDERQKARRKIELAATRRMRKAW